MCHLGGMRGNYGKKHQDLKTIDHREKAKREFPKGYFTKVGRVGYSGHATWFMADFLAS